MFDINGSEFIVILLVAAIVIGPQRLPGYAEQLGALVRKARVWMKDAKGRIDAEMGDDALDVDWRSLDPRQYDPRRIVRDALMDPEPGLVPDPRQAAAGVAPAVALAKASPTGRAPFDTEAT
ncbi:twin-arginine translocase TatA/TatE family subunit [Cellulomonas sp. JH27-2]|uniref:Sec-independent protein translocase subunit TatA/TatB n=1 Tax=Cellulomonas sp. JH27-2 TaxID=2774139 RepID=UPI00177E901B|nr:twin-arginine translocase TatA/TatE family subunit [Cellulomonas sp. JH27-2]